MRNKVDFGLYLITDRKRLTRSSQFPVPSSQLLVAVKEALKAGVKAIQLREKDLSTRELLRLAYKMRELTKKYNAKLFINDRLDIALAVEADGVHLTQNSIPADAVREAVHACLPDRQASRFLIGVSTPSLTEAKEAERAGADFITLGPIYRTPSKLKYGSPFGIVTLREISKKIKIPVFAIGGVKSSRIKDLKKTEAYGVAMISEVFRADNIQKKAGEIINILEERF